MEAVGAYIMRLVCACLICGILQSVYLDLKLSKLSNKRLKS